MAEKKGQEKIDIVLGEFKRGKLKSSTDQPITSRKQALAIALSEAGLSGRQKRKKRVRSKK